MHRDCATSCAASSPAAPTATISTTTTTTTTAVTAAIAAAAAAATITEIAAATAPMAATAAAATENDDDLFNFCDARTGVHHTGVNLDNLIRVERVNTTPAGQGTCISPLLIHVLSGIRQRTSVTMYVVTNDIDVVLMTQTWLASGDAVILAELTPGGFNLKDNPRPSGRTGGGVGVLFKKFCHLANSTPLNMVIMNYYVKRRMLMCM